MTRDRFRGGYTWEEWLEEVVHRRAEWRSRYRDARLGPLRAAFQDVPAPRYVACIVDDACADSAGSTPYIARACEQAGGVELRVFSRAEDPELLRQYQTDGKEQTPVCVVFDGTWRQVGIWGPRPEPLRNHVASLSGEATHDELVAELEAYYADDAGQTVLTEFAHVLRGDAVPAWRAGREAIDVRRRRSVGESA